MRESQHLMMPTVDEGTSSVKFNTISKDKQNNVNADIGLNDSSDSNYNVFSKKNKKTAWDKYLQYGDNGRTKRKIKEKPSKVAPI